MAALLLAGCSGQQQIIDTTTPPPEPLVVAETETPPIDTAAQLAAARAEMRISIAAVGDMMIGTDYPRNHLPDDDGESFLSAVAPIISSADIAFGNLEGVLHEGGEPGKKCSNPAACYLFRSPPRYAKHYAAAGFDVISLANNHARDFGEEGRSASMQYLDEVGIHHSGRVDDFASFEKGGLKIGMVAFAVTKNSNMMLDLELAVTTVTELAAKHDILIVSFHGGAEGIDAVRLPFAEEEYYGEPRGDVVRFARTMVDCGADIVLGHGPHVVRAMEVYKGRLIAYSLGNFATYYGISVAGIKGVAPILVSTLDGAGRFIEGTAHSTIQRRPGGPEPDPQQRAFIQLRDLSIQDFGNPGLRFENDGKLAPIDRETPPAYWLETELGNLD